MKPVVAIAMSGGIDSLVSASLLKNEGFPVFGIHFTTGFESAGAESRASTISKLSEQVGFPVHVVDLSHEFRTVVVDYFIRAYREGTTPNPCLVCNPAIKFDRLFESARELGANRLATGHYARVMRDAGGVFHLLKGLDPKKDQSYFLSFLSQEQLSRAIFPLGELSKSDVRRLADQKGLSPVSEDESQDVCFIQEKRYTDFLIKYAGVDPEPGPVVTTGGDTVGRHDGLHRFTVGQRRGINCPSIEPYYVVRLIPKTNTLVVGRKHELESESCIVDSPRWIGARPELPLTMSVRLRYRHRAVPATVSEGRDGKLTVSFQTPQNAPTPGQGAVFYIENEVLGAGIISS
jgi:tRNA-specific 2-thiouridylase